jgi:protein O-GlcNAc transferase
MRDMGTIAEEIKRAVRAQNAGRLQDAESIYRRVLDADPRCADAWHLLGVVCLQTSRSAMAAEHIARSIELLPTFAAAHNNLGSALMTLGRRAEAVAAFRRAAALDDTNIEAHRNLGFALKETGEPEAARTAFGRVVARAPNDARALAELAKLPPSRAPEPAPQPDPDNATACVKIANEFLNRGDVKKAIPLYQRAIDLRPDYAIAHHNLGSAFKALDQLEAAHDAYRKAVKLDPNYADGHCDLGTVLIDLQRYEAAESEYRRTIELDPNYTNAYAGLAYLLKDRGQFDDAIAAYRQVLRIKPNDSETLGDLLLVTQYRPGVTSAALAGAHREFEEKHASGFRVAWTTRKILRAPGQRLRVGFVSPDFGMHPVGYLLIRGFEHFDRTQLEVACYCDRKKPDEVTTRFQRASDIWHDTRGWSDDRVDAQIRKDGIDILYDLSGHTARNRMLVFARKPAPIQVSWLGYEGTTGVAAIDSILGDPYVIPPEAEPFYPERVFRFLETYVCYDPPAEAPAVAELPALGRGFVTFGCFNNPAKLNAGVIETWTRILQHTPRSRLVLKYRGLTDNATQSRLRAQFTRAGIGDDRVSFEERSPFAEYLAAYGNIDVALDPFPFSGGVTTCEALWMGVPVLTLPGQTFAGRHSLSYLTAIGLTEWIATDVDDYIARAVAAAGDVPRLAAVRAGLRERMAASPLCDGALFARRFLVLQQEIERDHAGRS